MTRGECNNNPTNIRISPTAWKGKLAKNTDGSFEQFDRVENGIRAGAKIICNYYRLYGLQTVAQIVARWAPSTENDTRAYIDDVANRLGVGANDAIDLFSTTILAQLVSAIIHHENGIQSYDWGLIELACQAAIDSFNKSDKGPKI